MLRAARDAMIDDDHMPPCPGCRHEAVLSAWSTAVTNDFETKNNDRVITPNGKVSKVIEGQNNRLDLVEKRMANIEDLLV